MRMNRVQSRAALKGLGCIDRGAKIPAGVLAKIPAAALEAAAAAAGKPVKIYPTGFYDRLGEAVSIAS